MAKSIETVYMVEASKELRETQKILLCGQDTPSTTNEVGSQSTGKYGQTPIIWTESIKSIPKGTHCLASSSSYQRHG